MNFKWGSYPFLRFVFAFILGIVTSINGLLDFDLKITIVTLTILYLLIFLIQKKKFRTTLKPVLGVIAIAILFCFGYELTQIRTEKLNENHIANSNEVNKIKAFKGCIIDEIKQTENSYKTIIKATQVYKDSSWTETDSKILCYFKFDSNLVLNYGDELLITSKINEIKEPKNPDEFDYKKYLSFHQIHHQTYSQNFEYQKLSPSNLTLLKAPNTLLAISLKIRNKFSEILQSKFKDDREFGIINALVLGAKGELENDIVRAYSGVGAMHVLAVSGLHVGLVYQVLSMIFSFLRKRNFKIKPIIKTAVLLLFIWSYTFITGLSPSVIRAATMFSLIIVGESLGKNTNIYNTLAVSAFLLLCINPFLIVEVGFQLSYLAVIGIVYLQPKIYEIFNIENKFLDQIWNITCVSIAAQIATFPISILYFHQFPTYFFISNIVVIPAAIFILYGGLALITFSWIEPISNLIGRILEFCVFYVNEIIIWISLLPNSLIGELNISTLESLIIYFFIIFILVFIAKKKLKYFIISVSIFGLFSFIQINENVNQNSKKELIFYSVNKSTAIGFRDGNSLTLLTDSLLINDEEKQHFHIKNHWWKENLTSINKKNISSLKDIDGNRFYVWNGLKIMFYSQPLKKHYTEKLDIDYLIIQNNIWIDKSTIDKNINYKHLIIDGTNNWKTRNFVINNFANSIYLIENGAQIFSF